MDFRQHILVNEIMGIRPIAAAAYEGDKCSANCSETANIGDLVFCSGIAEAFAHVCTCNRLNPPAVGVIVDKPTNDTCEVRTYGECTETVFSNLEKGKKVFVGCSGRPTTDPPSRGFLQIVGRAYDENRLFVDIEHKRVKRSPF